MAEKKIGNMTVGLDSGLFNESYTETFSSDQSSNAIISPSSGHKLSIIRVRIESSASSGEVELDFASSSIPIARLYASHFQRISENLGGRTGAEGEDLTLNSTLGSKEFFLSIQYIEVEA